jgi:hypothetical protein
VGAKNSKKYPKYCPKPKVGAKNRHILPKSQATGYDSESDPESDSPFFMPCG